MVPTSVRSLCRKISSWAPKVVNTDVFFCNWPFVSGDFTREEPELKSGGGYHFQRSGCDLWHWSFKSGNSFVVSHWWGKVTKVLVPFFLLVRDRFKRIRGSLEDNSQTLGWETALVEVCLKGSGNHVLQVYNQTLAVHARQSTIETNSWASPNSIPVQHIIHKLLRVQASTHVVLDSRKFCGSYGAYGRSHIPVHSGKPWDRLDTAWIETPYG